MSLMKTKKGVNKILTIEKLKEHLHYDEKTGEFTSNICSGPRPKGYKSKGCKNNNGYLLVSACGKQYYAHRLAWFYFYGEWPKNHIDHIDGDRANNAITNLRDVDRKVNIQNRRKATSTSVLGVLGVTPWIGGRFRASIGVDGVRYHLGLFNSQDEAYQAYLSAKRKIHEGCTI